MNCQQITSSIGYQCTPVSDTLLFVESPLTLGFDGSHIGAYIEDIGRAKVRITDNSCILFTAMTHGITPSSGRAKKLKAIAAGHGLSISDDGELYTACDQKDAAFYLARFMEAAGEIGMVCQGLKPSPPNEFERIIARGLARIYKGRVKRDLAVTGASGHQLTFPFVIDGGQMEAVYIQTLASPKGSPDWKSVYHTLGKMTDLQNAREETNRVVIIERGQDGETQRAATALSQAAKVVIYDNEDQIRLLAA